MRMLEQKLPPIYPDGSSGPHKSLVDEYFGIRFACELKNDESDDEPVKKMTEEFLQLSCFISTEVRNYCLRFLIQFN